MAVNSSDHDFAPGSFVVKQKNEVVKPMVFDDGDAEPVSKFGGRGAAPVSYGGLPKGLHQVLYERGLAPRTLAGKQIATSTNARWAAVLDFLETEGRHNSKYSRTDYCQHCTKFDEETGEVIVKKNAAEQAAGVQIKLEDEAGSSIDSDESTDSDSLIECTYCNLCFHVHCCDHTTGRQVAAGGVVGAWPCPDCIEHAETQLNLEPLISQDAGASEDKPVDLLKAAVVYGSIHSKWSVSDMCSVMGCQIDFMEQTSMLEEVVAARGYLPSSCLSSTASSISSSCIGASRNRQRAEGQTCHGMGCKSPCGMCSVSQTAWHSLKRTTTKGRNCMHQTTVRVFLARCFCSEHHAKRVSSFVFMMKMLISQ